MKAIILAAGRGSRMQNLTSQKPKCLLSLAGKTLLEWQLQSLNSAGIQDILVVRGYKAELLQGIYDTIDNTRWNETNMVQSLLCAYEKMKDSTCVLSYADIVYNPSHVEKLLACEGDICLSYDKDWQELWQLRAEGTGNNILDDTENFLEENNKLQRIGSRASSLKDVHGQYMGLLKITPKGFKIIKDCVDSLSKEKADKLDMTSLLALLLENHITINTVPISGAWCECDTEADIEKYEQILALHTKTKWKHDWR